jgi:hypothetical protein
MLRSVVTLPVIAAVARRPGMARPVVDAGVVLLVVRWVGPMLVGRAVVLGTTVRRHVAVMVMPAGVVVAAAVMVVPTPMVIVTAPMVVVAITLVMVTRRVMMMVVVAITSMAVV